MTQRELKEKVKFLADRVDSLEAELEDCRQSSDEETIRADNEAERADDAEGTLEDYKDRLRAFKGMLEEVESRG